MSLASAEKEHKSSEWVERATPYVHGFTSENGDRREKKSRAWRLEIQTSARDGVILNQQHPDEMSNENLVQFLQDMYIYTRVVQFQYEVPATLSIKAPPSPLLPGLNPPNRPSRFPQFLLLCQPTTWKVWSFQPSPQGRKKKPCQ